MTLSITGEKRFLTSDQLGTILGTNGKGIQRNYQRHSHLFVEGTHFHVLAGNSLKNFKEENQLEETLKFVSILYLWTNKGAWLHVLFVSSDKAIDLYKSLIDAHFDSKE